MLEALVILGGLGFLAALGLSIAAKKFAVKEDPRIQEIIELLPGANCGSCGYAGCSGFAQALLEGKAQVANCPASSDENRLKIAKILGIDFVEAERMVAVIHCQGTFSKAAKRYIYDGIASCRAAHRILGGDKFCKYGCLGFGDCVKACPFGASEIRDGVSYVNSELCVGCGKCVEVCPRSLIRLLPKSQQVFILCSSHDKGAIVRKICQVGCIACRRCERACPYGAIEVKDNLARIITEKCRNCGVCAKVCPTSSIVDLVVYRPKVEIDQSLCDGCDKCRQVCPVKAIDGEPNFKHVVNSEKCVGCGACINVCPKKAINRVSELKKDLTNEAVVGDVA